MLVVAIIQISYYDNLAINKRGSGLQDEQIT